MCRVSSTVVVGKQGLRCRGACSRWLVASCFGLKGVCMFWNKLMDGHNWQPNKRGLRQGSCLNLPGPGVALLALNEENLALLKNHPGGSKTNPPQKLQTKNQWNQPQSSREPEHREEKKQQHQGAAKKSALDARNPTRFEGRYLLNFVAPIRFGRCWDWRRRKLHHSYLGPANEVEKVNTCLCRSRKYKISSKEKSRETSLLKQHHFFENLVWGSQSFCP